MFIHKGERRELSNRTRLVFRVLVLQGLYGDSLNRARIPRALWGTILNLIEVLREDLKCPASAQRTYTLLCREAFLRPLICHYQPKPRLSHAILDAKCSLRSINAIPRRARSIVGHLLV